MLDLCFLPCGRELPCGESLTQFPDKGFAGIEHCRCSRTPMMYASVWWTFLCSRTAFCTMCIGITCDTTQVAPVNCTQGFLTGTNENTKLDLCSLPCGREHSFGRGTNLNWWWRSCCCLSKDDGLCTAVAFIDLQSVFVCADQCDSWHCSMCSHVVSHAAPWCRTDQIRDPWSCQIGTHIRWHSSLELWSTT